ncbi:DUF2167 domain-containing protein [Paenibacillus sp. MER 99-2]|uniref:DUF2167 domain-containing protein n=1 Tax=Paenibacillus sp. MER 99-2 TaxID=2939572 RepID=UPI00203D1947|nr:DUF2167 domain-containing protein [Paenibacillus sp. MER 99-2]MCM3175913.1 DUF2167 domain-containing protein [Paenibacillus sp. MER 99-2]
MNIFKRRWKTFMLLLFMSFLVFSDASQVTATTDEEQSPDAYNWIAGPATVDLDSKATLEIPESYFFLNKANTQRSMLNAGGKPNGNEIGSLYNNSDSGSWYVVFEYVRTGHIRDDDQKLDANELLSSYIRGTEAGNREAEFEDRTYVTGWEIEPTYDSSKHQLIYSLGFKDAFEQAMVNYNVHILTREGYVSAILVTDLANFQQNNKTFEEAVLNQLSICAGYTYEEYDASTDKTSTIGLKSLIWGGIGYTGSPTNNLLLFLKKSWFIILIVVVGLIAWIRFKRSKGDEEQLSPTERMVLQEADEQQNADQNELSYYRHSGQPPHQ